MVSFATQKFLICMKSNVSTFFFYNVCFWCSDPRRLCLTEGHEDLLVWFSLSVIVLVLTFRSMVYFELISVYGMK